jgi:hypothetical protein
MTHKDKAKKYFKDEYLNNHSFYDKEAENKIDKMFYHLFEAIKKEIVDDLDVSSPELSYYGRLVDLR